MASADTPHFSLIDPTGQQDHLVAQQSSEPDELATFSVLANPDTIAGTQVRNSVEAENSEIVDRLRAELQRRAKQVEDLSRDRATTQSAKASTEDRIEKLSNATQQLRNSDDTSLQRLLHAAHRARRQVQEQLRGRDAELEASRHERVQLCDALQKIQREFESLQRGSESQSKERARVRSLKSDLGTTDRDNRRLTDECNTLRRALVEAKREVCEANKASQRSKEVLAETRSRVMAREAEASALRGALSTNQQQAQSWECDNEGLQAALSIAGETLEARRAELKALKAELATAIDENQKQELRTATLDNELAAAREFSEQQTRDLSQMKSTLPRLEKDLVEHKLEIDMLSSRRDERETEIARLRESLTQTQMRRDAVADDLTTERQALALARNRAVEREATLATLRETLTTIGKAASAIPLSGAGAAVPAASPRAVETPLSAVAREPEIDLVTPSKPAIELSVAPPSEDADADSAEFAALRDSIASEEPGLLSQIPQAAVQEPPPIFHSWRDRQIAKKLAPLGVTGADDYFVGRIERLLGANPQEVKQILSLGGEDASFELRIARGLRQRDHDNFRIHFPESHSEHAAEIVRQASQAGLDRELVPYSRGEAGTLDDSEIHAIISDGALSRSDRIESLVEALARATNRGALLVVAERIGTAGSQTAREMGDRIWQLMPERYKLNRLTQQSDPNYWNESTSPQGCADLLSLLRAHFLFEDFASFGHLVNRFVDLEIGPNFDPEDDRDRRFIEQIASLDEAKLDAGALTPLHMVARLSARNR